MFRKTLALLLSQMLGCKATRNRQTGNVNYDCADRNDFYAVNAQVAVSRAQFHSLVCLCSVRCLHCQRAIFQLKVVGK